MAATTSFRFQDGRMHQAVKDQPPQQIYPEPMIIAQAHAMFAGMQTPTICTSAIGSLPPQLQAIALAHGYDLNGVITRIGQQAIHDYHAAYARGSANATAAVEEKTMAEKQELQRQIADLQAKLLKAEAPLDATSAVASPLEVRSRAHHPSRAALPLRHELVVPYQQPPLLANRLPIRRRTVGLCHRYVLLLQACDLPRVGHLLVPLVVLAVLPSVPVAVAEPARSRRHVAARRTLHAAQPAHLVKDRLRRLPSRRVELTQSPPQCFHLLLDRLLWPCSHTACH